MANTGLIKLYILFLVIFSFFAGSFGLLTENEKFELDNKEILSTTKEGLNYDTDTGNYCNYLGSDIASTSTLIVSPLYRMYCSIFHPQDETEATIFRLPYLMIKVVILLGLVLGTGFSILPTIIQILLITPISIFIIFDYILPYIRGN